MDAVVSKDIHRAICYLCGQGRMCRIVKYTAPRWRRPRNVPVCYECVSDDGKLPNVVYVLTKGGIKMSRIEDYLKQVISQQEQILSILGDKYRFFKKDKKEETEEVPSKKDGKKKIKKGGKGKISQSLEDIKKAVKELGYTMTNGETKIKKIFNGDTKVGVCWENGRLEHKSGKIYNRVTLEEFLQLENVPSKKESKKKKSGSKKVSRKKPGNKKRSKK